MRFVPVIAIGELLEAQPRAAVVDRVRLVLVRRGGEVFALADRCSHEDAPLAEGLVDGDRLECPRHGALFDLRTGRALSLPAAEGIASYPVRVVGGQIEVGIEDREAVGAA
jgi:nitrite reductase/ring-hydroxylating ferredoxin subunit